MTLLFDSRSSDAPHVHQVGSVKAEKAALFSVVPDGSWGLVIFRRNGQTRAYLTGATTKPIEVSVEAGEEILSVSFKPSAYVPGFSSGRLVNDARLLAPSGNRSIWWSTQQRVELPTFDNVEDFVNVLVKHDQLAVNGAVAAVLEGRLPPISPRTLQRHFLRTTGMTQNYWQQIQRAQKAAAAIQVGKSLAQVAAEAGYVDQAHMTRWLKQIIGRTPAAIARDTR